MRVGVYLRLSDDRDGTQTATARQREDCLRFAESREWEVVDVFEDVDLSAYKRNTKRPEFERMLAAVRNRDVDGVLAWKVDRITRRMWDFVRLDEACESVQPKGFVATVADGIDTRTPTGRFVAELLVAQARMESQNTATRVERAHLERVKEGKPQVGGRRVLGYDAKRTEVIPEEAALVREARDRIFAGETLHAICYDWRERGLKTTLDKDWHQTTLKRLLCGAAISGQREHRGVLSPGNWPAIISPEDTQRLRAMLVDPARRTNAGARKYLLTGLLYCSLCGERLIGRPNSHKRRYVCNSNPGARGCGKIYRMAEPLEAYVTETVLRALEGGDVRAYVEAEEDGSAEVVAAIRSDEDSLAQLTRDYYVEKRISRAEFFAARDELEGRLEGRRRQLGRSGGKMVLSEVLRAGDQARALWGAKGQDWRRAVLSACLDRVEVLPARVGRTPFDPDCVELHWRW